MEIASSESMTGLFFGLRIRDLRISLSCVVVALSVTLSLQPLISHPFLDLFWMAAVTSAWYGGVYQGFLTVFISTVLVDYFLIPPFYSFAVNANQMASFVAFIVCSIAASLVISFGKRRERTLEEACNRLRVLATERAVELQKLTAELQEKERQRQQLESEKSDLSDRLEARKLVERAKGILQRKLGTSEDEAYRAMQRQSQQMRKSMKEISESIILNDDLKRASS